MEPGRASRMSIRPRASSRSAMLLALGGSVVAMGACTKDKAPSEEASTTRAPQPTPAATAASSVVPAADTSQREVDPNCVPETDAQFCAHRGKSCRFTGADNCGKPRTAECGTCTAPERCSTAGPTSGTCTTICDYESDTQFCACIGHSCGGNT